MVGLYLCAVDKQTELGRLLVQPRQQGLALALVDGLGIVLLRQHGCPRGKQTLAVVGERLVDVGGHRLELLEWVVGARLDLQTLNTVGRGANLVAQRRQSKAVGREVRLDHHHRDLLQPGLRRQCDLGHAG